MVHLNPLLRMADRIPRSSILNRGLTFASAQPVPSIRKLEDLKAKESGKELQAFELASFSG